MLPQRCDQRYGGQVNYRTELLLPANFDDKNTITFGVCDVLRSPHGKYALFLQLDGNLVIYGDDGSIPWATGTNGNPVPDGPPGSDALNDATIGLETYGDGDVSAASGIFIICASAVAVTQQTEHRRSEEGQDFGRVSVDVGRL